MSRFYQKFEARAFPADPSSPALEGTIFFTAAMLRFESNETVIEIPLHRLVAERTGEGDCRIVFGDSQQPGLQIVTADESILEIPSVPQLQQLSEQLSAHLARHEISSRLKLVVGFFAACGLILWLGMLATGAMVRAIVNRVPPEFEKQVGDAMLEDLKNEMGFAKDTNQEAQLTALAEPLLRVLPGPQPQWQFYVVTNKSPNAFALPGGHIVIFTGLLELVERPEELLGVVAHEVAHVTRKHTFRQQVASAGPFLVLQIFLRSRGGATGVLAGGSALLVTQSFSQEYEKEADDVGWGYLVKANIDPRGMIEMFRKFKAYEQKQKYAHLVPQAFSSHPQVDKRIARLESKLKKLPHKSGFVELEPGALFER